MKIYLGADHGGFALKQQVKLWLRSLPAYEVMDCGNTRLDPDDDYPDFAFAVGEQVAADPDAVGLLFCRSGGGMVIAANKIRGIRAVDVFDFTSAVHAKTNNNANIISIGADWTDPGEAKLMIENFLTTPFMGEERHVRRIGKIGERESSL